MAALAQRIPTTVRLSPPPRGGMRSAGTLFSDPGPAVVAMAMEGPEQAGSRRTADEEGQPGSRSPPGGGGVSVWGGAASRWPSPHGPTSAGASTSFTTRWRMAVASAASASSTTSPAKCTGIEVARRCERNAWCRCSSTSRRPAVGRSASSATTGPSSRVRRLTLGLTRGPVLTLRSDRDVIPDDPDRSPQLSNRRFTSPDPRLGSRPSPGGQRKRHCRRALRRPRHVRARASRPCCRLWWWLSRRRL